jgi:hypothetical protein
MSPASPLSESRPPITASSAAHHRLPLFPPPPPPPPLSSLLLPLLFLRLAIVVVISWPPLKPLRRLFRPLLYPCPPVAQSLFPKRRLQRPGNTRTYYHRPRLKRLPILASTAITPTDHSSPTVVPHHTYHSLPNIRLEIA